MCIRDRYTMYTCVRYVKQLIKYYWLTVCLLRVETKSPRSQPFALAECHCYKPDRCPVNALSVVGMYVRQEAHTHGRMRQCSKLLFSNRGDWRGRRIWRWCCESHQQVAAETSALPALHAGTLHIMHIQHSKPAYLQALWLPQLLEQQHSENKA